MKTITLSIPVRVSDCGKYCGKNRADECGFITRDPPFREKVWCDLFGEPVGDDADFDNYEMPVRCQGCKEAQHG